jgi:hypothetical protein
MGGTMHQAFYQSKPKQDTPYRQLDLTYDQTKGWVVRLFGGTKWVAKGDKDPEPMKEEPAKDFDTGKIVYDEWFRELRDSGWRPYSPYETWD